VVSVIDITRIINVMDITAHRTDQDEFNQLLSVVEGEVEIEDDCENIIDDCEDM
jgi:hypothetical protein